jgi:hypothetical protein
VSTEPIKRTGMVWMCDIPAGSKLARVGDWLVVAAPDASPFMVHGRTGERREIKPQPLDSYVIPTPT